MKRSTPVIGFLLMLILAFLAFGSAYGLNRGIASFLVVPESAQVVAGVADGEGSELENDEAQAAERAPGRRDYVDGILKRNIFDAEFIALYNPAASSSESNEEAERKTDLKVRLIGTVVAEPAAYSSALIADDDRNAESLGYGIGDKLYDAQVTSIEARRVTLRRADGTIEFLTMDADDKTPTPKTSSVSKSTDSEDDGIQEVAEGKYIVSRETMDKYTGDLDALSRMGRALLHRGPDGEYDGYRMSAIRRNSMADKLGIKNGDIVHSVNGMALNSMSGAMNAMQTLQTEAEFGFEITRRGQKSSLSYEIR